MTAGDRVRVSRAEETYEGVLLPSSSADTLVVKLEGGYNVEVLESDVFDVDGDTEKTDSAVEFDEDLPTVALISTGGTIASTVDYRTGAVTAQFDAEDVLRAVPDLAGRANYRGRVVANILSENMTPEVWVELANVVHEAIEAGADGVVVMHGTDTMQQTASALSFMLETPVPVVFTGSQRSADRPSSDNVMNAVCAVEAATADCAELLVCMHESGSDRRCALHRATRVRKNHTSKRAAFETIGGSPLGHVTYDAGDEAAVELSSDAAGDAPGAVTIDADCPGRGEPDLALEADLETDVELVQFSPDMDPAFLDVCEGKAGLVLAGTGLGHVSTDHVAQIESLVEAGTSVVMTSQCLDGRVCDRVYDTGRDLLDAGVIEGETMLPGTALTKLMWVLANRESVAEAMQTPLAGELSERTVPTSQQ